MKPNERGFSEQPEGFIESHPFALLAVACMLVLALFSPGAAHGISPAGIYFMLAAAAALLFYALRKEKYRLLLQRYFLAAVLFVMLAALFLLLLVNSSHPLVFMFLTALLVLLGIFIYWKRTGTLSVKKVLFLIAVASFLLRVMYILYTPYDIRQHDVYSIGSDSGHMAYIEYLLSHNFALPDFDPRTVFQFYQPPLHYMLAAAWVKINVDLGMEYRQAVESIQVLTLFYSGCITILSYRLLREFRLRGTALIVPFAILCFHPSIIILSGSINNDILCFTLMLAAVLAAVRWYKRPGLRGILLIALLLGLAMNAKVSAGLMAPAVAVLFAVKLVQAKGFRMNIIGQLAAFGCLCIPLGLWWVVKNNIQYGMPLTYVPMVDLNAGQYIGDCTWYQRFFDFSPARYKSIFIGWEKPFRDYNIWITTLKSAVFDEYATDSFNVLPAKILYYSNILLVLLSVICGIVFLYKKQRNADIPLKAFLCVLYAGIFCSYLKFCLDYPHICTMSFRYIVMTLVVGAVGIGFALNGQRQKETTFSKVFIRFTQGAVFLFCLSSTAFFTGMQIVG